MLAEPLLARLVEPVLDPRWLYAVRSGVVALLLIVLWSHYPELHGSAPRPARASGWLAAVAVGLIVFAIWILLDRPPFVIGESAGYDPRTNGSIHWGLVASRLAGSTLVVPVMEELFWRSFILRWLHDPNFSGVDPKRIGWKALLISSALFATEHHLIVAGLLAGLAYGGLYRWTGDLRAAVLAHAVTNGVLGVWIIRAGAWTLW